MLVDANISQADVSKDKRQRSMAGYQGTRTLAGDRTGGPASCDIGSTSCRNGAQPPRRRAGGRHRGGQPGGLGRRVGEMLRVGATELAGGGRRRCARVGEERRVREEQRVGEGWRIGEEPLIGDGHGEERRWPQRRRKRGEAVIWGKTA
jgi:hypothetical protein